MSYLSRIIAFEPVGGVASCGEVVRDAAHEIADGDDGHVGSSHRDKVRVRTHADTLINSVSGHSWIRDAIPSQCHAGSVSGWGGGAACDEQNGESEKFFHLIELQIR